MAAIFQFFRWLTVGKAPKLSLKHTFEGHQGDIQSIVFLQDNIHIISGSDDGTIRKWDCETGQLVGEPWKVEDAVYTLALSPDGKKIACGRRDGSVQRWDAGGQMMEDIWTGHSDCVRSLSWSPSEGHLASGSFDGTILVRNIGSGGVEVGPIKTYQGQVYTVAYSPLGDRIASGGDKATICIWNSRTGELLVGPIKYLWSTVTSVVWSSDGSKLYSASDEFVRVFDSTSGTELHRFQHDHWLYSVALSPQHNLLACVGDKGTPQLWDTESHLPFLDSFANYDNRYELRYVSFSPDGRYLAYSGINKKITLWTVKGSTEHPVSSSSTISQGGAQQEPLLPKSQSSSSLNVDATDILAQSAVNDDQGPNDPYNQFFVPSHSESSPPSPSPNPSPMHRLRHVFSVLHLLANASTQSRKRFTRSLFPRRVRSTPPLPPPPNSEQPDELTLKGESRATNQDEEHESTDSSESVAPGTTPCGNYKGKQQGKPLAHTQASSPNAQSSPAHPSAAYRPSHRSQPLRPPIARRVWTMISSPRHRLPCTEPQPVTVYAARPRKLYWRAPRRANKQANTNTDANANTDENANTNKIVHAQTVQSPSARVQPSAVQPESGPYRIQDSQTQAATQPTRRQYDFGCWGNFGLSFWCIPRPVSPVALPSAS